MLCPQATVYLYRLALGPCPLQRIDRVFIGHGLKQGIYKLWELGLEGVAWRLLHIGDSIPWGGHGVM